MCSNDAAGDQTEVKNATVKKSPCVPEDLRLVILNNLGEAYFRLGQYDDMVLVYDHLKKRYTHIVAGGPFLNQDEKQGMLSNTLFLKRPDLAAAA